MSDMSSRQGIAAQISPHETRLALRVNDACAALGVSRSTLYQLISGGKLKTAMIAGRRVIPMSELARLLSESMTDSRTLGTEVEPIEANSRCKRVV